MTILPSIATSLRKKYNKWLFMSRRPNQNRPVPNSSTDQGGGKRRRLNVGEALAFLNYAPTTAKLNGRVTATETGEPRERRDCPLKSRCFSRLSQMTKWSVI